MVGSPGLRELSRRAVRSEIAAAAQMLFAEQGYEATTVDQIAEQVGMSQRTFFRYFGSKEDLVLEHYERLGANLEERLLSRPEGEDAWCALRRSFDVVVEQHRDPEEWDRGALAQSIVESSPALLSAYLKRMESAQLAMTRILHERGSLGGDGALVRAVVGAAFAALQAVASSTEQSASADEFEAELDRIMRAMAPR